MQNVPEDASARGGKTMKRLICLVFCFVALYANIACGKNRSGPGSTGDGAEQEEAEVKMKIQAGNVIFTAVLEDNSSVDALKELMADGPLTLNMSDYAGMEKGADLGVELPQNNEQMNTQAGDIILYQGRTFVIYYDTNSWSLTPIGKIENVNVEELRAALGDGDVTVTLSMETGEEKV